MTHRASKDAVHDVTSVHAVDLRHEPRVLVGPDAAQDVHELDEHADAECGMRNAECGMRNAGANSQ